MFESVFLQRRVRLFSARRSCARNVPRFRGELRMGGDGSSIASITPSSAARSRQRFTVCCVTPIVRATA